MIPFMKKVQKEVCAGMPLYNRSFLEFLWNRSFLDFLLICNSSWWKSRSKGSFTIYIDKILAFLTTYSFALTFSMVLWTLTKSGHFLTTYLPRLVNVVCERPQDWRKNILWIRLFPLGLICWWNYLTLFMNERKIIGFFGRNTEKLIHHMSWLLH